MAEKATHKELNKQVKGQKGQIPEGLSAESVPQEYQVGFETLLNTIRDGVYILDRQGRITYVNEVILQRTGRSREWFFQRHYPEAVRPEERKTVQENIEAALRGEEVQPYELSHIKPSGEILWLEVNIAPLRRGGRIVGVLGVSRNITYRKRIEQAKDKAREQLEEEVDRRTRDLWEANYLLEQEIEDRKRAENILRQREQELNTNAARLEELNTALKILVKRREKDRLELEQRLLRNVRELVLPYVEKLENSGLNSTQKAYLDIIRSNLDEILSPFSHRLSTDYLRMTPKEIDIANLIKQGKTTKEVAFLMKMSKRTVEAHRDRIRRKLGLRHRKINLRTHLLAIQ